METGLENLPSRQELLGNRIPNNGEWVQDKDDASLHVRFYFNPVTNKDQVEIRIPGDERTVIDREVTERDKLRFQPLWNNYCRGLDEFDGQHRLDIEKWIDRATLQELQRFNIRTLEQLAGMSDGAIDTANMLGIPQLRARAIEELGKFENSEVVGDLRTENQELKARLEAIEANLPPATEPEPDGLPTPEAPAKRGPGRPRKTT